jgi:hypothetical protein
MVQVSDFKAAKVAKKGKGMTPAGYSPDTVNKSGFR